MLQNCHSVVAQMFQESEEADRECKNRYLTCLDRIVRYPYFKLTYSLGQACKNSIF